MGIHKLPPCNGFNKKEEDAGSIVPVHHSRHRNLGLRYAAEKF